MPPTGSAPTAVTASVVHAARAHAPRVVKLIAGHGAGGGYELPDGQAPGTPRQGGRCGSVRWDAGDVSAQKRPRPVRRHAGWYRRSRRTRTLPPFCTVLDRGCAAAAAAH